MMVFLLISGNPPQVHWLLIVPLVAIYYVFVCGLALVTARMAVHWRDLINFLPFLTRFVFYTTGIFFSVEKRFGERPGHPGHPIIVQVSNWQPIHEFLSLARSILLGGEAYTINEQFWFRAAGWAFGLFAFGLWFFWRAEERYGRVD